MGREFKFWSKKETHALVNMAGDLNHIGPVLACLALQTIINPDHKHIPSPAKPSKHVYGSFGTYQIALNLVIIL